MSIELLKKAIAGFSAELAATPDSDWSKMTKCEGWTVTDLMKHMVGGANGAAAAFRGGTKEDAIAAGSGDALGSNPRVCNSRHPDAGARHLWPPPVGTHPGVPRRQRRLDERLFGFFGGSISLKPLYMRAY